jgi:hypothetical protein
MRCFRKYVKYGNCGMLLWLQYAAFHCIQIVQESQLKTSYFCYFYHRQPRYLYFVKEYLLKVVLFFFINVGPPKESIFLATFYGLYFSHQLHMLQITILFS